MDKSTIKDVLKYHSLKYEITEKIEFEKPQGLWFHFYNAANHEQDLNFFLTSYGTRSYLKAKHQRLQLTSISIWNNDAAYFDGDLRIGKSSFADISSKFKLDTTTFRSSAGITGFDKEAGLNFSFNALRILQGVTMFSTGTNVKKPSVQVH
ncbi:MAG TPA: hypothetical protein VI731_05255 [Bacteroidia bacterium]|nr:hypothetical protein [Bacteroidia bacterium]